MKLYLYPAILVIVTCIWFWGETWCLFSDSKWRRQKTKAPIEQPIEQPIDKDCNCIKNIPL